MKVISGVENLSLPADGETKYLSEAELANGYRFACMCELCGDAVISVGESAVMSGIQTAGLGEGDAQPTLYKLAVVTLDAPTLANPISDDANLVHCLSGDYKVTPLDFKLIKKLSKLKEAQVKENRPHKFNVLLKKISDDTYAIADISDTDKRYLGAAVDIGTTTVAVYIVDLLTGERIGVAAAANAQSICGADVISRISYVTENERGASIARDTIIKQILELIRQTLEANNIDGEILSLSFAGNTVMEHLAGGVYPGGIASAPFAAGTLFGYELPLSDISDTKHDTNPQVYFAPCVASYVGGDITAGIVASETDRTEEYTLFLDIGTNGEIGLGNKDSLLFCATAAGPAFEGAHIKKGVAGIHGAINKVRLDGNSIVTETIGGGEAVGICGSGIIDALALLLDIGAVDETGRLTDDPDELPDEFKIFADRIQERNGETVFVFDLSCDIYITEKDIREIQLAKASVCAGILTLLHSSDKNAADIDRVVLAGGFGAHLDRRSACKIGLIPAELETKIIPAGNTAGVGAAAALIDYNARQRLESAANDGKYIELSGDAYFLEQYVEMMMF
ncbi:iron-sulfur cluster-binding protein [Clostridia bacterium]|nr:iron-sulfur cluster-binding protein [Clostridia bacterium]